MVSADKKDFKNGYKKHYSAYKALSNRENGEVISRRLLLNYSVECGLKYMLLEKWGIYSVDDIRTILKNKNHPKHNILGSHNLRKMLKELHQEGEFEFPQIRTSHKENITCGEFHQMQRYGIPPAKSDEKKTEDFEIVLKKVAEWIGDKI